MRDFIFSMIILIFLSTIVFSDASGLKTGNYEELWKLARSHSRESDVVKNKKDKKELLLKSIDYAKRAMSVNPDRFEGHLFLAEGLGKLSDFVSSKEKVRSSGVIKDSAQKAIELNPSHYEAYLVLGVWHRKVVTASWIEKKLAKALFGGLPDGSIEESEENLKKAIRLNPDFIESHYELALTYKAEKKKKLAKEEVEKALQCSILGLREEEIKKEAESLLKKL